jgi:hypothetical protein
MSLERDRLSLFMATALLFFCAILANVGKVSIPA